MVRFFAAGMFVGFPLGCYLREAGLHKRIQAAYKALNPGEDAPKMNQFRDTTQDFYRDLQAGRAQHQDFERFIYGQYGEKSYHKDDRDHADQRSYEERKRIENEFTDYMESEKARKIQSERQ